METQEFVDLLKFENKNLELVREEEPFLDETLTYLVMALAHDCCAWDDPRKGMEANLELIESVARYGAILEDQWKPEGILVFGGKLEQDESTYNSYLRRALELRNGLLQQHMAYFNDSEKALRETNTCLTYMIAIGCARSTDLDGSLRFVDKTFRKVMDGLL